MRNASANENVPAATAKALMETGAQVRPHHYALAVAQDRFDEKSFFASTGIATPAFAAIASQDDLDVALAKIGAPAILKTRRFGYDGRGQIRIMTAADTEGAFERLGAPGILDRAPLGQPAARLQLVNARDDLLHNVRDQQD